MVVSTPFQVRNPTVPRSVESRVFNYGLKLDTIRSANDLRKLYSRYFRLIIQAWWHPES